MFLQSLQRLAREPAVAHELPREGYRRVRVRYKVRLDSDGRLLGLIDLAEGPKPPGSRGTEMEVPNVIRTSGVKPLLFADGADYTFGLVPPNGRPERVAQAHSAYRDLVAECAAEVRLPAVDAAKRFIEAGALPDGVDPSADAICFEVGDQVLHELPEVFRFWGARARGKSLDAGAGECLVCGQTRAIVSRWPVAVKGVPGGQTSGNHLASANAPAFLSYGLEASATSPACYDCARESALALNWLLSRPDHHLRTSPTSVFAFWTRGGEVPFNLATLISEPTAEDVRELLQSPRTGSRGATGLTSTSFNAVSLSPSGSRIAVRGWIDASLPEVQQNLAAYFRAMSIVQPSGDDPIPIRLNKLVLATTRDERDFDSAHPGLATDLLNLALTGRNLPPQAMAAVLRRVTSEQKTRISHARAAMLKLALVAAQPDEDKEAFMQRLDADSREPAYLCGRLLAELEAVQRVALGNPKSSLTDRYFGAASSAPATVFGPLLRNAQNHLAKLRKERYNVYRALDRRLEEISSSLTTLPNVLTLRQQAVFALGYYHQKADDRASAKAHHDANLAAALLADQETEEDQ